MFGPVSTTEAHLAYAGAGLHSSNTAELSSVVEVLSYLGPNGPVARDSQACIFHDSKHAANISLDTIQSRANVLLGLTLQAQSRLQITMQHICIIPSWNPVLPNDSSTSERSRDTQEAPSLIPRCKTMY